MEKREFREVRTMLGKSQRELAVLLGVSLKAVESYEQGWRDIPATIERMAYYLLFKSNPSIYMDEHPCWEAKACGEATRNECIAFVAREGHFCWFITGGLCVSSKSSEKGEGFCHGCEVFLRMKSLIKDR